MSDRHFHFNVPGEYKIVINWGNTEIIKKINVDGSDTIVPNLQDNKKFESLVNEHSQKSTINTSIKTESVCNPIVEPDLDKKLDSIQKEYKKNNNRGRPKSKQAKSTDNNQKPSVTSTPVPPAKSTDNNQKPTVASTPVPPAKSTDNNQKPTVASTPVPPAKPTDNSQKKKEPAAKNTNLPLRDRKIINCVTRSYRSRNPELAPLYCGDLSSGSCTASGINSDDDNESNYSPSACSSSSDSYTHYSDSSFTPKKKSKVTAKAKSPKAKTPKAAATKNKTATKKKIITAARFNMLMRHAPLLIDNTVELMSVYFWMPMSKIAEYLVASTRYAKSTIDVYIILKKYTNYNDFVNFAKSTSAQQEIEKFNSTRAIDILNSPDMQFKHNEIKKIYSDYIEFKTKIAKKIHEIGLKKALHSVNDAIKNHDIWNFIVNNEDQLTIINYEVREYIVRLFLDDKIINFVPSTSTPVYIFDEYICHKVMRQKYYASYKSNHALFGYDDTPIVAPDYVSIMPLTNYDINTAVLFAFVIPESFIKNYKEYYALRKNFYQSIIPWMKLDRMNRNISYDACSLFGCRNNNVRLHDNFINGVTDPKKIIKRSIAIDNPQIFANNETLGIAKKFKEYYTNNYNNKQKIELQRMIIKVFFDNPSTIKNVNKKWNCNKIAVIRKKIDLCKNLEHEDFVLVNSWLIENYALMLHTNNDCKNFIKSMNDIATKNTLAEVNELINSYKSDDCPLCYNFANYPSSVVTASNDTPVKHAPNSNNTAPINAVPVAVELSDDDGPVQNNNPVGSTNPNGATNPIGPSAKKQKNKFKGAKFAVLGKINKNESCPQHPINQPEVSSEYIKFMNDQMTIMENNDTLSQLDVLARIERIQELWNENNKNTAPSTTNCANDNGTAADDATVIAEDDVEDDVENNAEAAKAEEADNAEDAAEEADDADSNNFIMINNIHSDSDDDNDDDSD
jgi:hypothetical protein